MTLTNSGRRPLHSRVRGTLVAAMGSLLLVACGESPDQMVTSARGYIDAGDRPAAVIQLKNALQEQPDHAEARFLLGRLSAEAGDYATAAKEFSRARSAGYPEEQIVPSLALALLKSGDAAALVEKFASTRLQSPEANADLLAIRGDALLQLGQFDQGRAAYDSALSIAGEHPRAKLGLARLAANGGDLAGARSIVESVVSAHPDLAEGREILAAIDMAEGRTEDAIAQYRAVIEADPKQPANHFRLISLLIQNGQVDAAKAALAEMKKATGGRQVYALYLQAYLDYQEGNTEAAAANINKVVGAVPDFTAARLLAGAVSLNRQDYNQALQHLGVVLSVDSQHALARRLAGTAHLMARDPAKTLELIGPLLSASPNDSNVQMLAGQARLALGDFDGASAAFEQAVSQRPEDAAARVRLGVSRLGSGASEQAFADLEQASRLDPEGIQADVALSMARMKQGKYAEALAAADRILAKQPENPLGANLRGGTLLAEGRVDDARAAFEQALAMAPNYLPAAVNLSRLDLVAGDPKAARARLDDLVRRDAKNAGAHLARVDLMGKAGATADEIEQAVRAGAEAVPDSSTLKVALASILAKRGNTKEALSVALAAQASDPEDPRVIAMLAATQLAAGNAEQAVSTYGQLVALQPGQPRPLILLAAAQKQAGSGSNAEQTLRKAVRQYPDAVEPASALAALLIEQRDLRRASEFGDQWLAAHPDNVDAHLLVADVAVRQSDWKRAIASLRTALDMREATKTAVALHMALTASGDTKGASRMMSEWLAAHPKDAVARGYLAERYLAAKDFTKALETYRAMSKLAPDNALILNNMAWTASQLKDPAALDYAQRALTIAPDNPAVLDTLGMIRLGRGERDEAVSLLEKAVAGAPQAVAIGLNLARAYVAVGDTGKADVVLDRLVAAHPEIAQLPAEVERIRAGQ
ncbi:MAG: PEP-CTERM system TPR-repeat protein PrsT [Rhodocyclaceae bacterium]|nr:PEP-CTERM system TPR-repeat protein PrsT [Rhodocyclaceae bacterium]